MYQYAEKSENLKTVEFFSPTEGGQCHIDYGQVMKLQFFGDG